MTFAKIMRATMWALFVTGLGFAYYLYPAPAALADAVDASNSPASILAAFPDYSPRQVEAFRASARWLAQRGWYANLIFFVLGSGSSLLWLWMAGKNKAARYAATAGLLTFAVIVILALAPSRIGDLDHWTELLGRLARIHRWGYVATEIQRLVAIMLSAVVLVLFCISAVRRPAPANP
jgi:uncharacterized membrane protein